MGSWITSSAATKRFYRVVQILNRRTKNNPCLIGEPRRGKTAIAEGIAQRIAAGRVPLKLKDKEIHLLDMTALVAGTQSGDSLKAALWTDRRDSLFWAILFYLLMKCIILVGAEVMRRVPMLQYPETCPVAGEIQVIGATTFSEYRKYIEKIRLWSAGSSR